MLRWAGIVFSLCFFLSGCGTPGPRTWTVDTAGTGDYTTVANAVFVAKPGDTIVIKPGIYREQLDIDKAITVRGAGSKRGDVVLSHQGGTVLTTRTDCVIENLSVSSALEQSSTTLALSVEGGKLSVTNCELFSALRILKLNHLSTVTLKDSQLSGTPGIAVICNGALTVENCDFNDNVNGAISVESKAPVVISKSRFKNNNYAVFAGGKSPTVEVVGNTIVDSTDDAVAAKGEANLTVRENTITNSKGCGVRFFENATGTVEKNTISKTGQGFAAIRSDSKQPSRFVGNTLREVHKGMCAHGEGLVRMEDNDVTLTRNSGICVEGRAEIHRCRVSKANGNGIYVRGKGQATLDGVDVFDNHFALCYADDAQGKILNSKIHDNATNRGVLIKNNAVLLLDGNEIYNNEWAGIEASGKTRVTINNNKIHGNRSFGVELIEQASGSVSTNDLLKNRMGSIRIEPGARGNVVQTGNIIEHGPMERVRQGDWIEVRYTNEIRGRTFSMDVRTSVSAVNEEVMSLTQETVRTAKPDRRTFSRDLYSNMGQLFDEEVEGMEEIDAGKEDLVIGGKTVECHWIRYRLSAQHNNKIVKLWYSLAIPFQNALQREETENGKTKLIVTPVNFNVAASYDPKPAK